MPSPLDDRFRIPGGSLDLDSDDDHHNKSGIGPVDPSSVISEPPIQVLSISHLSPEDLYRVLSWIPHPLAPRTAEYAKALNICGTVLRNLDRSALNVLSNHDPDMADELARVQRGLLPRASWPTPHDDPSGTSPPLDRTSSMHSSGDPSSSQESTNESTSADYPGLRQGPHTDTCLASSPSPDSGPAPDPAPDISSSVSRQEDLALVDVSATSGPPESQADDKCRSNTDHPSDDHAASAHICLTETSEGQPHDASSPTTLSTDNDAQNGTSAVNTPGIDGEPANGLNFGDLNSSEGEASCSAGGLQAVQDAPLPQRSRNSRRMRGPRPPRTRRPKFADDPHPAASISSPTAPTLLDETVTLDSPGTRLEAVSPLVELPDPWAQNQSDLPPNLSPPSDLGAVPPNEADSTAHDTDSSGADARVFSQSYAAGDHKLLPPNAPFDIDDRVDVNDQANTNIDAAEMFDSGNPGSVVAPAGVDASESQSEHQPADASSSETAGDIPVHGDRAKDQTSTSENSVFDTGVCEPAESDGDYGNIESDGLALGFLDFSQGRGSADAPASQSRVAAQDLQCEAPEPSSALDFAVYDENSGLTLFDKPSFVYSGPRTIADTPGGSSSPTAAADPSSSWVSGSTSFSVLDTPVTPTASRTAQTQADDIPFLEMELLSWSPFSPSANLAHDATFKEAHSNGTETASTLLMAEHPCEELAGTKIDGSDNEAVEIGLPAPSSTAGLHIDTAFIGEQEANISQYENNLLSHEDVVQPFSARSWERDGLAPEANAFNDANQGFGFRACLATTEASLGPAKGHGACDDSNLTPPVVATRVPLSPVRAPYSIARAPETECYADDSFSFAPEPADLDSDHAETQAPEDTSSKEETVVCGPHDTHEPTNEIRPPRLGLTIPVSPTSLAEELSLVSPLFSPISSDVALPFARRPLTAGAVESAEYRSPFASIFASEHSERGTGEGKFSIPQTITRAVSSSPVKLKRGKRRQLLQRQPQGPDTKGLLGLPERMLIDAGMQTQTQEELEADALRGRVKALERELRSLRAASRRLEREDRSVSFSTPDSRSKAESSSSSSSFWRKIATTDRLVSPSSFTFKFNGEGH